MRSTPQASLAASTRMLASFARMQQLAGRDFGTQTNAQIDAGLAALRDRTQRGQQHDVLGVRVC